MSKWDEVVAASAKVGLKEADIVANLEKRAAAGDEYAVQALSDRSGYLAPNSSIPVAPPMKPDFMPIDPSADPAKLLETHSKLVYELAMGGMNYKEKITAAAPHIDALRQLMTRGA